MSASNAGGDLTIEAGYIGPDGTIYSTNVFIPTTKYIYIPQSYFMLVHDPDVYMLMRSFAIDTTFIPSSQFVVKSTNGDFHVALDPTYCWIDPQGIESFLKIRPNCECLPSCTECRGTDADCCIDGTLLTSSSPLVCTYCFSLCAHCDTTVTNCSMCKAIEGVAQVGDTCVCTGNYFYNPTLGICNVCEIGSYMSGELCLPCDPSCVACAGYSTNCIDCTEGFGNRRVLSLACKSGFYFDYATQQCQKCDGRCASCNGNSLNCSECVSGIGYMNVGNICGCEKQYYYDSVLGICAKCSSFCLKCISNDSCVECAGGYKYDKLLLRCQKVQDSIYLVCFLAIITILIAIWIKYKKKQVIKVK